MSQQAIYVTGPIAAGKSTLCTALAEDFGFELLPEAAEDNPYLPQFYADAKRWAFHAQLWFHVEALRHAQTIASQPQQRFVCDRPASERYQIFIEPLVNSGAISPDEDALLADIATVADREIQPRLIVALDCPAATLRERVLQRGRDYERGLDEQWLAAHRARYDRWWAQLEAEGRPLWRVRSDEVDFRSDCGRQQLADVLAATFDGENTFGAVRFG